MIPVTDGFKDTKKEKTWKFLNKNCKYDLFKIYNPFKPLFFITLCLSVRQLPDPLA